MKSGITREEFSKEVSRLSEEFAEQVWQAVVEAEADVERCDEWMRVKGSEWYCQVEAFRADPTPRCWQHGSLEPHYLAARSELETST